jgi:hypothetical protein
MYPEPEDDIWKVAFIALVLLLAGFAGISFAEIAIP